MAFLEGCGEVRHNVDAGNKKKKKYKSPSRCPQLSEN